MTAAGKAAASSLGITPVTFHELNPAEGAAAFHAAISAAKGAGKFGAAVHAYPVDDYRDMRLFLTADGQSGFALKGSDIVSAFKGASKEAKVADSVLALAIQEGGRKLDAFDTVLPDIYSQSGFRAVARIAWNDEFAPDGWSKETFAKFNGGEPDVVFMVYDPEHARPYQAGDGQRAESYEVAVATQDKVLERIAISSPESANALRKPENISTEDLFELGAGLARESRRGPRAIERRRTDRRADHARRFQKSRWKLDRRAQRRA